MLSHMEVPPHITITYIDSHAIVEGAESDIGGGGALHPPGKTGEANGSKWHPP